MGGGGEGLKEEGSGLVSGISLEIILHSLVRLTHLTAKEKAEGIIGMGGGVASRMPVGKTCVCRWLRHGWWQGTSAGRRKTESEMDELLCSLHNPGFHCLKSFRRNETPSCLSSQAGRWILFQAPASREDFHIVTAMTKHSLGLSVSG